MDANLRDSSFPNALPSFGFGIALIGKRLRISFSEAADRDEVSTRSVQGCPPVALLKYLGNVLMNLRTHYLKTRRVHLNSKNTISLNTRK